MVGELWASRQCKALCGHAYGARRGLVDWRADEFWTSNYCRGDERHKRGWGGCCAGGNYRRGLEVSAKLLHHHGRAYDGSLRKRIFAARENGSVALAELGELGREISIAYAMAVNAALGEANIAAVDVAAIAAHGQTLYHAPPNTIQWFDPALVAAEVGCAVVSDFRRADCAAGGQGAPLVPFADYVLFRHQWKHRVLVNIGGISNLTFLPAQCALEEVLAFDCGPGNCLSDYLMRELDPSGPGIDIDGKMAAGGQPIDGIWDVISDNPFFSKQPPKSTDVPAMLELFLAACGDLRKHSLADLLCTAGCIASTAIAVEIERLPHSCDDILASGGGVKNRFIVENIGHHLGKKVGTTDRYGVPSAAKEAMAFALLGAATLDGIPSNVPSATGAKRAVVLGSITPRP
jgi:anhydro-N-acetylmuramic acid kinase